MKVEVTEQFTDRHTHKTHNVGETMNVSVERVNEILSVGAFVKILETDDEKETPAAKKTAGRKAKTETE